LAAPGIPPADRISCFAETIVEFVRSVDRALVDPLRQLDDEGTAEV
jgi:hypothetical protein